jgi:hypothetical protein
MVNEVKVLEDFTIENWPEVVNSTSPLEVWTDLTLLLLLLIHAFAVTPLGVRKEAWELPSVLQSKRVPILPSDRSIRYHRLEFGDQIQFGEGLRTWRGALEHQDFPYFYR